MKAETKKEKIVAIMRRAQEGDLSPEDVEREVSAVLEEDEDQDAASQEQGGSVTEHRIRRSASKARRVWR